VQQNPYLVDLRDERYRGQTLPDAVLPEFFASGEADIERTLIPGIMSQPHIAIRSMSYAPLSGNWSCPESASHRDLENFR